MIIIIHGPSGSGKTLAGEYLKTLGVEELVSHTTRKKRPGEIHGQAYYFVDYLEFASTKKVEQSVYAEAHYGVSEKEVIKKHKKNPVFAVTDLNGVKAFKERFKDEVVVMEIRTSPRKMRERMEKRGESKETIRQRMKVFLEERSKKQKIKSDYIIDNNHSKKRFFNQIKLGFIKAKNLKFE